MDLADLLDLLIDLLRGRHPPSRAVDADEERLAGAGLDMRLDLCDDVVGIGDDPVHLEQGYLGAAELIPAAKQEGDAEDEEQEEKANAAGHQRSAHEGPSSVSSQIGRAHV